MIALMILYLICCVLYIFVGSSTLVKDPKSKINIIFFIICITLAYWAVIFSLMTASKDAETATFYRILATFSWSTVFSEILYFILLLTDNKNFLRKKLNHVLLFAPVVISLYLYLFNPVTKNDIVQLSYGWAILNPVGRSFLWDYFFNIYYSSYMLISFFLLINWHKRAKLKREKRQSKIIAISIIITLIVGSIPDVILPQLGLALLPPLGIVFIQIVICTMWYTMIKYGLMSITAERVVLDVFKIMSEGLIVFNQDRIIISANMGALQLLGYEESEIKGKSVDLVFQNKDDIPKLDSCNSYEIEIISKYNIKIPVLISSSVLLDNCGDKIGTVFIFQNLIEIIQIQNKLSNAYNTLELRVQERTFELSEVNLKLEDEIQARISKEDEIIKLALYDQLTGLPNRRLFNDQLNQTILNINEEVKCLAILFLDLDGFKMINDTRGHAQGDELLKEVATRLTRTLKNSDIIARVGGDEFLILLSNQMCRENIEIICEKIKKAFKEPFILTKHEIFITTSIGVSVYPEDGKDAETLVKNADIAMYIAKESGKGKFALCNQLIKGKLHKEMSLTNDLYRALENNELELYYQPQIAVESNRIVGFEALLRWNHPIHGLIGPDSFISIAEKTGLIVIIGEWVLRTACTQLKTWQNAGYNRLNIAVNISVNQIQSHKIVSLVSNILLETGLNPKHLELEITENILMKDINFVIDILNQLKALDVRIALDDFGTAYSSLKYLKQLPLDRIKIDKCFVDGIGINSSDESIISAIIILSKDLGLTLIAEGVETQNQLNFLKAQNCDEIQGFYYYKPMPVVEIEKILKSL